MANIYGPDYRAAAPFAAEKGNACIFTFSNATAGNSGDKIYMGIIPAGVRVDLARIVAADTGTGNTLDVGFEPEVGSDPSAVGNYWWNDLDTATAAVNLLSTALPVMFDKPVKVVVLINSANLTGTPNIQLTFIGEMVGAK